MEKRAGEEPKGRGTGLLKATLARLEGGVVLEGMHGLDSEKKKVDGV